MSAIEQHGFDLIATIDGLVESAGPSIDIDTLAAQVAMQVPPEQLRAVLASCVARVIRHRLSIRRMSANHMAHAAARGEDVQPERPAEGRHPRLRPVAPSKPVCPPWETAAGAYASVLKSFEHIDGKPKQLRFLTADEIRQVAAVRTKHAQDTLARARTYERLADQVDACGVATAGDLTEAQLAEVFAA